MIIRRNDLMERKGREELRKMKTMEKKITLTKDKDDEMKGGREGRKRR